MRNYLTNSSDHLMRAAPVKFGAALTLQGTAVSNCRLSSKSAAGAAASKVGSLETAAPWYPPARADSQASSRDTVPPRAKLQRSARA
jgi:hypothetical protein